MNDSAIQSGLPPVEPDRPHLWNPNSAALWSLAFTPAFGAYLHAVNWRILGEPKRAMANLAWVWAAFAFLAINLALLFVPDTTSLDAGIRGVGIGLTDFGISTISRWERGRLLQNRSNNKFLQAIRDCPPFREYLEKLLAAGASKPEAESVESSRDARRMFQADVLLPPVSEPAH